MNSPFEPHQRGFRGGRHGRPVDHFREHMRGHLREHLHDMQGHGPDMRGPDMHNEFDGPPFPEGPGFGPHPGAAFRAGFPPVPPGPGFGPGFGFGFATSRPGRGGGRGHGRGHGPGRGRARRGNVRTAVLLLLAERSMHGYEIIQQITERSRGWWKPSPGSVYPTLQLLADEGLVTTEQDSPSGKRLYALTDEGRAEAEKQDRTPPWEQAADEVDANDVALREALSTLMSATMQLSAAGTPDLRSRAARILVETRRQLYLLLADAGMDAGEDGSAEGTVEDAVPDDDGDED